MNPLARIFRGRADVARHAELTARFPEAYVVRAQAVRYVRPLLAQLAPSAVPARDAMLVLVVDARGLQLWGEEPEPFLELPWESIGVFSLHSYIDYPIWDLLSIYRGHATTVISAPVGERTLELALWGDEQHDQTESLLDEYGLRTALARIEGVRRGVQTSSRETVRDATGRPRLRAAPALPPAAITITRLPRFTIRRQF